MLEKNNELTNDENSSAETENLNDNHHKDTNVSTDAYFLEDDDIVEATDKKEYVDEP